MEQQTTTRRLHRFGRFELDLGTGELRKDGLRVRLQEQPFRVLAALLEHPGELVTRDELRRRLWPDGCFVGFEPGLNNAVARLRQALGDQAGSARFVETLARRGYRFVAPLHVPEPDPAPRRPERRRLRAGLRALLAVAAVLLALGGPLTARGSAPRHPGRVTLAVLPFEDLTTASHGDGLGDALAEELSARLGGLDPGALSIGREREAEYLLEGSVLRSSGRIRVSARCVHAPDGTLLWSRSYESDRQDAAAALGQAAGVLADEVRRLLTAA